MADITTIDVVGDWRVVVQSRDAGWDQRIVCEDTASGTRTVAGQVGASLDIFGDGLSPWRLRVQHNDGSGWADSWLRPQPRVVNGTTITQVVESEDITTPSSDRDFNDLVVRLEKIGMVDQPTRPFSVYPTSLTMMPDGVFEAALGRYFMGVTVRNIWTETWPAGTRVGLTQRSRQWLQSAGVQVIDAWSTEDQAAFGQEVVGGRVTAGALAPWASRLIYFKVNVSGATVRKHNVEVSVQEPANELLSHVNPRATGRIFVSRTTYDPAQKVFVSRTDRGMMTASVRELVVDYNTFKRAIGKARELFGEGGAGTGGAGGGGSPQTGGGTACTRDQLERIRRQLVRFLAGDTQVDVCGLLNELQCCCGRRGSGDGEQNGDTWTGSGGTGMEFISFPSVIDYRVDYVPPFTGQFGPLPYDDPWWKVVLAIVAIILTLAAAASAAADLANRSDDVVIGQVTRSVLLDAGGLVDASVVRLNGNRGLRPAIFSYLDAATGELNTVPVDSIDGIIDTAGATMTNVQIAAAIAAFTANPLDPAAQAGVRVFKSGARTGLTFGRMAAVEPLNRNDDGVTRTFVNQVRIDEDPAFPNGVSNSGDSGSLWVHVGSRAVVALNHAGYRPSNTAWGSRIEDVMNLLGIRFA